MAAIRLPSASAGRSASITFPARPTACRSHDSPQRKPCWRNKAGTRPYDATGLGRAAGSDGLGDRGSRPDKGTRHRPSADRFYSPNAGTFAPADQPGPGHRTTCRAVAAADAAGAHLLDGAADNPVLSVHADTRSARPAKAAILSERPAGAALAARLAGCQPRQRALPRDPAATQPAEFALM